MATDKPLLAEQVLWQIEQAIQNLCRAGQTLARVAEYGSDCVPVDLAQREVNEAAERIELLLPGRHIGEQLALALGYAEYEPAQSKLVALELFQADAYTR